MSTIYTIGHSRHPAGEFVALLHRHAIGVVLDVRGQPYSRRNPQFNRERLKSWLESRALGYEWHGDVLSGRPAQRKYYGPRGGVLWDRLAAMPELIARLDAVAARAGSERLGLMCAEEDPRRCHRRLLLTAPLADRGIEVMHVRGDGGVEPEAGIRAAEERSPPQLGLFE